MADLKQELKIRNISLPTRQTNEIMDSNNISTSTSSPSKNNNSMDLESVSKLNDINDSKNNNSLSLNASMDTTLFNNSSSVMDTTIHNTSCETTTDSIGTQKSHNDTFNNKPSQNSVLKCKLLKMFACWKF